MIGPGQAGCGYLRQLETLNFGRLKPPNFSESEMRKLPIFIGIHRLSLYFVEASSHGYDYQQVTLLHMSNEHCQTVVAATGTQPRGSANGYQDYFARPGRRVGLSRRHRNGRGWRLGSISTA